MVSTFCMCASYVQIYVSLLMIKYKCFHAGMELRYGTTVTNFTKLFLSLLLVVPALGPKVATSTHKILT